MLCPGFLKRLCCVTYKNQIRTHKLTVTKQNPETLKPTMTTCWGHPEEAFVKAMKAKANEDQLVQLAGNLQDPNAHHILKSGAHFSLLFHAVTCNSQEGFHTLIAMGADLRWVNQCGNTVIMLLTKRNILHWAEDNINKLSETDLWDLVNSTSASGSWTPLMSCCEHGALESAQWLLEYGADPNACMVTGWTALHAAAKKGNLNLVQLLLKHGASKGMVATHRSFGSNLLASDVTNDPDILAALQST